MFALNLGMERENWKDHFSYNLLFYGDEEEEKDKVFEDEADNRGIKMTNYCI
jgi:hypothetical protein